MGKRQELELEAIRLYADGNDIPAIAAELQVSENSLRKWKARAGDEWQQARKATRQSNLINMEDVGSRLRRSREIAAQMTGSAKDQGTVGLILNQGLQTMIYDVMEKIDTMNVDSDEAGKLSKVIGNLTLALGRTEQAGSINVKRENDIRKQALEQATVAIEKQADTMQLKPETLDYIKKVIYGLSS